MLVCLDPGHGPDTVNGSPDGAYKEAEFTWNMSERIKPLLEAQGIRVIVTRAKDTKPSLRARARVSNDAGADLFVSLHSNAYGNGEWTAPSGLLIYTAAAGAEEAWNQAAQAILARLRAAGVTIRGTGLLHNPYTVLTETEAPAVLIEYGFHTNRGDVSLLLRDDYRELLAVATAKGICDFLGVPYIDDDGEEGLDAVPSDWAAEAWNKAVTMGVMDGTAPQGTVTREMLAVVLDRLGLLS